MFNLLFLIIPTYFPYYKMSVQTTAHFFLLHCLPLVDLWTFFIVWIQIISWSWCLSNSLSQFVTYLFLFLVVCFWGIEVINLSIIKISVFTQLFCGKSYFCLAWKFFYTPQVQVSSLVFFCKIIMILPFPFKSLFHLDLIFV